MAKALTSADRALNATDGKANFQRLTRLLVCGGVTLLREVFDSIHPLSVLPTLLGDPTIKGKLQRLRHRSILTQPEWNQLYPSPGVYGKSKDFDITLLFKLLRNICSLTPPGTGWDSLPNITDLSLEADLVRIKFYRNEVYGHSKTTEISDPKFVDLWREISEALLRIAGSISDVKRVEWRESIEKCLHDPLTPDAESDRAELDSWYQSDMIVKGELEKLRNEVIQMNIEHKEKIDVVIHIITETFKPCACGSSDPVIAKHYPITPKPPEAQQLPESVCVPISPLESQTEGAAEWQSTRRQTPSTVLDFWHVVFSFKKSIDVLMKYLRIKLGLDIIDSRLGSLLVTVTCSSLEVLEELWEDYRSGHLSEVVQETLVTPEVLSELDLSEVTLKTIILEDEYKSLKKILKNTSDTLKQQSSDETSTGAKDENDETEGSDQNPDWEHLAEERSLELKHAVWFEPLKSDTSKQQMSDSRRTTEDSGFGFRSLSFDSDDSGDIDDKGRDYTAKTRVAAFSPETEKRSSGYHAFSLDPLLFMDYLPYWSRHYLIKTLDPPHRFPNWRNLAQELSLEQRHIQWLEELPASSSPTDVLLRMMEAHNHPLGELAETLRKLGRDDAANIIEEHLGSSRETSTTCEGYDTKL